MNKPKIKNRIELAKHFKSMGFTSGAEVGVHDGRYSEILCQNIPGLALLCVDIWKKGRIFDLAKEKLAPYNTTLIQKPSLEAAEQVPDESLDFVFIDANHEYKSVKQDIEVWSRKVKKGGVVSGHDYYVFRNTGNRGVIDAVDEYVEKNRIPLYLTDWDKNTKNKDDRQPCWYYYK